MGGRQNFQYSLRTLFATLSVGSVFVSLSQLIGLASIPATLALIGAFLSLWEWLASRDATHSCTKVSWPNLFICAAIMAHITLLMAFIPQAANIASKNCKTRYYEHTSYGELNFDPTFPIEYDEWLYPCQLAMMAIQLVVFGFPGLILVAIGSAITGRVRHVRGLTRVAIGCYLVLLPLCVGYWQILKY